MTDNKQINIDVVLKTTDGTSGSSSTPSSGFAGAVSGTAKKMKDFAEKVVKGKTIGDKTKDANNLSRFTSGNVLINMITAIPSIMSTLVQGLGAVVVGVLGTMGITKSIIDGLKNDKTGSEDPDPTISSSSGVGEASIGDLSVNNDIALPDISQISTGTGIIGETQGGVSESSGIEDVWTGEDTEGFSTNISSDAAQITQSQIDDTLNTVKGAKGDLLTEGEDFNGSISGQTPPTVDVTANFDESALTAGQLKIDQMDLVKPIHMFNRLLPTLLNTEVKAFDVLVGDNGVYPKMETQLTKIIGLLTKVMNPETLVGDVGLKTDYGNVNMNGRSVMNTMDEDKGRIGEASNTVESPQEKN